MSNYDDLVAVLDAGFEAVLDALSGNETDERIVDAADDALIDTAIELDSWDSELTPVQRAEASVAARRYLEYRLRYSASRGVALTADVLAAKDELFRLLQAIESA